MSKQMIIAASILAAGIGAASVTAALAGNDNRVNEQAEMQALMGSKISITVSVVI